MIGSVSGGELSQWEFSHCMKCGRAALWLSGRLMFPESSIVPPPHVDCPESVRADYEEASRIVTRSPRGAAALLRLAVQKLCKELGEKGENINADIASLAKKGLPVQVQQSLDVVRVVGNNAVHPGSLDLKDNVDAATTLFALVNLIVQIMITQPKQVTTLYTNLVPKSQQDAIAKRDSVTL